MENNIFEQLVAGDNAIIALLSTIVLVLSTVIVYQWSHTMKSTVPKWIWDSMVCKIDELLKIQMTTLTIIKERLK